MINNFTHTLYYIDSKLWNELDNDVQMKENIFDLKKEIARMYKI